MFGGCGMIVASSCHGSHENSKPFGLPAVCLFDVANDYFCGVMQFDDQGILNTVCHAGSDLHSCMVCMQYHSVTHLVPIMSYCQ